MKYLFLMFLYTVLFYSCKIQNKSIGINDIQGKWKIIKVLSLDQYELEKDEIKNCVGKEISFYRDSIISNTECFSETCYHPNYDFKKVDTKLFFENDTAYINLLGFHSDSTIVAYTSCNNPYYNYIKFIGSDTICIAADDKAFILVK